MRTHNYIEKFSLVTGFIIGILVYNLMFSTCYFQRNIHNTIIKELKSILEIPDKNNYIYVHSGGFLFNHKVNYDNSIAEKLDGEIKILCLVLTQPSNHESKAAHVKNTWGNKCNRLIFLSSKKVSKTETITYGKNETRDILWGKVKNGFDKAYKKYHKDYDWFLKADDDSYIVMENLRHKLYQFNPQASIIVGHKYAVLNTKNGYMAGGGYVLSKKAVEKLINNIKNKKCRADDRGSEDLEIGKCLENDTLFIDGHDKLKEKQFFPVSLNSHMNEKPLNYSYWYTRNEWYNTTKGSLKCCSEYLASLHYITPREMYKIDYLIYNVYPFGINKADDRILPQKYTLLELIKMSDEKSPSPNYVEHKVVHNFDDDENFTIY